MAGETSASERTGPTGGTSENREKDNADKPRSRVIRLADRGRERAVEQLHKVAQAVRDTGEHMGDDGGALHNIMNKVADQIEHMSEVARSRNPRDLVDAIERFARRDRALFLGSAVTLGIFAARFLRSSSRDQGKGGRAERSDKEEEEHGGQDDQGVEAKKQDEKGVAREEAPSKRGASDDDQEEAHDEDETAEEAVVEVRPSAGLRAAISESAGPRTERR